MAYFPVDVSGRYIKVVVNWNVRLLLFVHGVFFNTELYHLSCLSPPRCRSGYKLFGNLNKILRQTLQQTKGVFFWDYSEIGIHRLDDMHALLKPILFFK